MRSRLWSGWAILVFLLMLASCESAAPDYQGLNVASYELWEGGHQDSARALLWRSVEQFAVYPPETRTDSAAVGKLIWRLGALLYADSVRDGAGALYRATRPFVGVMPDTQQALYLHHLGILLWHQHEDTDAKDALKEAWWIATAAGHSEADSILKTVRWMQRDSVRFDSLGHRFVVPVRFEGALMVILAAIAAVLSIVSILFAFSHRASQAKQPRGRQRQT